MKVYLNGSILPIESACVSVLDHGLLYGDGVFETLRAYNGVVFKLQEHLRRLYRSLSLINLDIGIKQEVFLEAVNATLDENALTNAYIRITVTRGSGDVGLDPALCSKPTILIYAKPFVAYPEKSVKVAIVKTRRNIPEAIDTEIKSLNFLNNILAKIEAKAVMAHEALMLNYHGHMTECTVSNIFFVKDEILYTPSVNCGILYGITRKIVLEIARQRGLKIQEGEYFPATLYRAQEVFLTNTTMEVMPVHCVDDVSYHVGRITLALQEGFAVYRDDYIRKNLKGTHPL
ncbi:MAG: aminotransferase class IV [Nitrospirae bacterium]|nr:aminotransferase class IV [Nitrospirota bacterium]